MNQTITVPKSFLENLLNRLNRLERFVFGKNPLYRAIDTYENEKEKGKLKKLKRIEELFS